MSIFDVASKVSQSFGGPSVDTAGAEAEAESRATRRSSTGSTGGSGPVTQQEAEATPRAPRAPFTSYEAAAQGFGGEPGGTQSTMPSYASPTTRGGPDEVDGISYPNGPLGIDGPPEPPGFGGQGRVPWWVNLPPGTPPPGGQGESAAGGGLDLSSPVVLGGLALAAWAVMR